MHHVMLGALIATALGFGPRAALADEPLFSEYVEGSSFNKALELYNPGSASIDLSSYQVEYYFNGSSAPGRTIALSGTLAGGDVFVLAHSSASSAILSRADQTAGGSWYNGDDAVVLRKGGAVIDAIGDVGFDPGNEWGSGLTSTRDNTLRRRPDVCAGDTQAFDNFDPALEWDGFVQNTSDGLGSHDANCGGGGGGGTPLHEVQGSGAQSPLLGTEVTVEAIVVGDLQGSSELGGFFLQEEDADADADPSTSEGVFVAGGVTDVSVGDLVQVTGIVEETFGQTRLAAGSVAILSSGLVLPTPAEVVLPLGSVDELERFEGMRVHLGQELTVTENFTLGRFGEVWLSSSGRLMQPTAVALPGAPAATVQAANDRNRILVDDGSTVQNPDPIIYPAPALSASNTLRSGDTVTGVVGVLGFDFGNYRVHATETPLFVADNPRAAAPLSVGGNFRVASFNVLNYFNGTGTGGGFPTARGADSAQEFQRQRDKIIAAITAMEADVIGLMEIENDGYGSLSAIQDLVNGLNAAAPSGTSYDFIDPGVSAIGTDAIAVGIIYRVETAVPAGAAAILDSSVDSRFDDSKNRPTLAQTFDRVGGGRLTVAVNHLKSKGSSCDSIGDPDTGDGQGNCNLTRASAAEALVDWLATDPTASGDGDVLIIGDMNAYAQEDPIAAITAGGYTDLVDLFVGADVAYSFIFAGQAGYLDHALGSFSLVGQVSGITEWHINTDEPISLDYNTEFKSSGQVSSLYAPDAFRASDHDPVLIGLTLSP
ncbi:ExeM/NucH family extracellular endonuclease [Haliangium sp.]|uniref:ExeM/NucH family extracellular endonuclease n=1 Tax=Haliangium sp. TaxID=2663208 RepID=UPI003D1313BC